MDENSFGQGVLALRLPIARGVGLKLWVLGVWTILFEAAG